MASVDDRIVAMQFDNKSFEEKIATTISSLDKLKTSLDFANATKNLGDLQKAGSAFSLAGIATAVEGMAGKFTAMGAIAFGVIQNIVDRAFTAGISIVKSLSLDQVISGFQEYETNLNAIQTVLANTKADGTTLDDVNAALQTLNEYSDQTIYNFGEMARNIGTFTAAGVDLDTSVSAIKGIANLAAISGSNSQQASTAMYQLSQALASGSVKLMDWNSIVNAGMGGEVFQKALFTTGQALGTIKDVPLGQTFDEWKDAGNTFRGSLEEGWLTAEVLTNTLQGFTGDLTDAQLMAMGYTEAQVKEIQELGKSGLDAATKVKTLTQLISTVKESIGSGWSQSFKIIIGDFEQAKELFTGLSTAIGEFVGKNADARNALLQGWADLGGRTALIEAMKNVFKALGAILKPIGEAFRSIFPKQTAESLFELTDRFRDFTEKLLISGETADKVREIFSGIFAALEIGWTIIKEGVGAVGDLFSAFADQNGSGIVDFFVNLAEKIAYFNGALVAGGGIKDFFAGLVEAIKNPGKFIDDLKDKLKSFFEGIDLGSLDGIIEAFGRIKDAIVGVIDNFDPNILDGIKEFFSNIFGDFDLETSNSMEGGFDRLGDRLSTLGDIMKKIGNVIGWFWDKFIGFKNFVSDTIGGSIDIITNFGPKVIEALSNIDFDKVLDLVQTGIAAVFAGGFSNISKNGLKIDLTGGVLSGLGDLLKEFKGVGTGIKQNLSEVTDTLEAMQLKLKAEALQKIAIAMGILAVSMILLSTVEPEALAKALSAMAVGFGELATTMGVMSKLVTGPKAAASLGLLATGMILLASAVTVMAVAVKIFSTMDTGELAKGLGAVILLIGTMVTTAKLLEGHTAGMVTAGVGMTAMAVALNLLAVAVKIFATMSMEELGKGLGSVAVGLGLIVAAMQLLPKGPQMLAMGAGLIGVGIALNLLATSMLIFSSMSWEELAKGMVAIAGGLLGIALGLKLMPKGPQMIAAGVGLVAIGIALNLMASALKIFATMNWGEIAKSLVVLAASLIILVVAARAMESGVAGAIAIGLMSVALMALVKVLKEYQKMSWGQILKGLVGLAATLIVLGLTAAVLQPLIPAMLGLGLAMLALGAGIALFGLGAQALAVAFGLIAAAGKEGVEILLYALDQLVERLPEMAKSVAESILVIAQLLLDAAPEIIASLGEILVSLIQLVIDTTPKLIEAFIAIIAGILLAIRTLIPDVVATGLEVLLALLHGVEDNIGEITTTVANIIVEFLDSITEKLPDIIESGANLLVQFLLGISDHIQDVVDAGIDILVKFIEGIAENIDNLLTAAADVVAKFIAGIGEVVFTIIAAGKQLIIDFITGMGQAAEDIATAAVDAIISFTDAILDNIVLLVDSGYGMLVEFINGIADAIYDHNEELRDAGKRIAGALLDGLSFGLSGKPGDIVRKGIGLFTDDTKGRIGKGFEVGSPSKFTERIGGYLVEGLALGLSNHQSALDSVDTLGSNVTDRMKETLAQIPVALDNMTDFVPTITPILDLTQVRAEAAKIAGAIGPAPVLSTVSSLDQARTIAFDENARVQDTAIDVRTVAPAEIKFEQNNYSPEALSTADIYRQTRNQIIMAKEELAVA